MSEQTLPKRCAFYLRVSDDDGGKLENSIEAQREACRSYVTYRSANGDPLELIEEFVDLGRSGKNLDRPQLKKLLALTRSRAIQLIIVYKLDRLSRSLSDFCNLVEDFKRDEVEIVSTTQNLDSSSSHGRMMIHILMAFAQYEREQTQERTSATMRNRLRQGKWNGGVIPFGYDYDKNTKALTPNAAEQKIYLRMVNALLEGSTLEQIAHAEKESGTRRKKGVRKMDTPDVVRVLKSPIPAGLLKDKNEFHKGNHTAIITRDDWDRVQAILRNHEPSRRGVTPSRHNYLLNGILWCGCCNSPMTGYMAGDRRNHYYACQNYRKPRGRVKCNVANVRVDLLDNFGQRLVGEIGRLPEVVGQLVNLVRLETSENNEIEANVVAVSATVEETRRQIILVKQQIKSAPTQSLVREEWCSELSSLLEREASVKSELSRLMDEVGQRRQDPVLRNRIHEALQDTKSFFSALPAEQRGHLVQHLVQKLVLNKKPAPASVLGPEQLEFSNSDEKPHYLLKVEFRLKGLKTMLSKNLADSSSKLGNWLPGKGSNLRPSD